MGNLVNLPNITPEALLGETAHTVTNDVTNGFSAKNYLNVRLDDGETSKKLTIRLLPMDLSTGNPFVKVHVHSVKVPAEISPKGYKSYLCLSKNADIDHETYGYKCPFCELNHSSYEESLNELDETKKASLRKISLQNRSQESVIVRCIERGKEDEGVKFWKFNIRKDQTDPYNQILNLFNQRKAEGEAAGIPTNILDIYNGVDLTVNITEGTGAPTITDGRFSCPISKDEEQMKAWIYDSKRWQDVFTTKSYEYLSLISEGKMPYFDKVNNVWIDKEEYNKRKEFKQKSDENKVRDAEAAITGGTVSAPVVTQAPVQPLPTSMFVEDEKLPY